MSIFNAHQSDRLQAFIDGHNLFGTLRMMNRKIDYKAFIEKLRDETRLVRAQYFTAIRPAQDTESFHNVLDYISSIGYTVETKYVRDSIDDHGHVRSRGNMLVEMTCAMLDAADNGTDHIVLLSGDGELTAAVEACKRRDCRVTVVSNRSHRVIAESLRNACDQYVDFEDLPDDVWLTHNAMAA